MRLVTVRLDETTSAGRMDGDEITLLPYPDVESLLRSEPEWRTSVATYSGRSVPASEVEFAPVVVNPEKIICVGANYLTHIREVGVEEPSFPTVFAKFSRSLIGAYDPIVLPAVSDAVDWEVELALVIDKPMRYVDESQALDGIAGYTIMNDITMRDWQLRTSQFLQGKTFEKSTPVGPYLVTSDELGENLNVRCSVDGVTVQNASTSEMLFSVAAIVAYLSNVITLMPGDLVATGTPSGVGGARKPPMYLTPGSHLISQIDGLGQQSNRCVAEAARLEAH